MRGISTTTSIAIGLGCIIASAVLAAHFFGLIPDRAAAVDQQRTHLAHVVAAQCSAAASRDDPEAIRAALASLLSSQFDVVSAGIRAPDGTLAVKAGPHDTVWRGQSTSSGSDKGMEIQAPILQNGQLWARVEIHFAPLADESLLSKPLVRMTLFTGAAGFLGSLLFLRKVLKHLDPSSVIPDRVRAMLDTLVEGVVIVDNREQIVIANEAFCRMGGTTLASIQGRRLSDLAWLNTAEYDPGADQAQRRPWQCSMEDGISVHRVSFHVRDASGRRRSLVASAVPILGTNGTQRGVLVTFDDVTSVEAANTQLRTAMDELGRSRDEIAHKNRELEVLASHDPLTGCLNRRAFMSLLDKAWTSARGSHRALACIMLDIDHFKEINDRYGHSVGDHVLRQMGQLLQSCSRAGDQICRYGGEEFCLLLPGASFEAAHAAAERLRVRIANEHWPVTGVTVSMGVTGIEAGAAEVHQLLDQADRALYIAKNGGRNRVVPWGESAVERTVPVPSDHRRSASALNQYRQLSHALFEALHDRDARTAEHSQRVSDLAVQIADGLCAAEDLELLRMAALLHDIGKLAVPDRILYKPGPLSPDEWGVIRRHESDGADLIERAMGHAHLAEIVRFHHAWFAGTPHEPGLPRGDQIPLLCRIVLVSDAFDALISDRPYRKGTTPQLALAELKRCAGTQFDPAIVARLSALQAGTSAEVTAGLQELATADTAGQIDQMTAEVQALASEAASAKEPAAQNSEPLKTPDAAPR